jgi:hypothetical protein
MATDRNSFTEAQFQKYVSDLTTRLNKKEEELFNLINKSLSSSSRSNSYWVGVRSEIDKIYSEMIKISDEWLSLNIPRHLQNELKNLNKRISSLKYIKVEAQKTISQILNSQSTNNIARLLYEDALASIVTGLNAGKNAMYRLTRLTQQRLIDEFLIETLTAEGVEIGNLGYTVGNIYRELLNRLDEGQFVIIDTVYKTGVKKGQPLTLHYKPGYYAEMVARTKFHEAQAQGALLTAMNYGTDLIQVSWHNTTTPICIPHEGMIYSISGTHPMFPPLMDTPPYHPNCLHLLYPTFEEGLRTQGTLQQYSDFSLGKINMPPIKNFIPLNQRVA